VVILERASINLNASELFNLAAHVQLGARYSISPRIDIGGRIDFRSQLLDGLPDLENGTEQRHNLGASVDLYYKW
jgi:hypothetical protein